MNPKILYNIHRYLMIFALLILLPIGIYYAIKKPENWFKIHSRIMFSVGVIVFISIFISLYSREFVDSDKDIARSHGTLGILILILIILQISIAIIWRKKLGENYLMIHKTGAILIVILVFFQLYLGISAYKQKYGTYF
jgi:hypothetical protein